MDVLHTPIVVPDGNVMLDVYVSVPDTVVAPTPPRRLAARALDESAGAFWAKASGLRIAKPDKTMVVIVMFCCS